MREKESYISQLLLKKVNKGGVKEKNSNKHCEGYCRSNGRLCVFLGPLLLLLSVVVPVCSVSQLKIHVLFVIWISSRVHVCECLVPLYDFAFYSCSIICTNKFHFQRHAALTPITICHAAILKQGVDEYL